MLRIVSALLVALVLHDLLFAFILAYETLLIDGVFWLGRADMQIGFANTMMLASIDFAAMLPVAIPAFVVLRSRPDRWIAWIGIVAVARWSSGLLLFYLVTGYSPLRTSELAID